MADSKFLKWQDKNGDMLPDVCPDVVKPAVNTCLNCSPNPTAIVPKWKKGKRKYPFLNEQTCMYQVGWLTPETTTGAVAENNTKQNDKLLDEIFSKYSDEAIKEALIHFNKDSKPSSIETVKEALEYTNYYLDPRPASYLKLLYSFPFDVLFNLPDAEEEEEEEEELGGGEIVVSYSAHEALMNNIRVRKGLGLYGRYLAVYQTMEGGNLLYLHDNRVFNLRDYGEFTGFTTSGKMAQVLNDLDAWLVNRGYNLPNTGGWFQGGDAVKTLEFTFDSQQYIAADGTTTVYPFKLKRLVITTQECEGITFTKGQLASLNATESWRDVTAVAYFARMRELHAAMSARVEQPWLEVLKDFTYPPIHATINAGHADLVENEGETTAGVFTCIADSLAQEGKQLGQDILNEFFSIADAVAYEWHKKNCQNDIEEVLASDAEAGKPSGAPPSRSVTPKPSLMATARTQAFQQVDSSDQIYKQVCAKLLLAGGEIKAGSSPWKALNDFSTEGFNRIAVCGFADLLLDGIQCLFGGLSLQDALSRMIKSALKAMAVRDFGRLFVGLSPEKQAELDAKVQENLAKKSLFPPDFGTTTYKSQSPAIGASGLGGGTEEEKDKQQGTFFGKYTAVRPWENPDFVKENDEKARADGQGNFVSVHASEQRQPTTRRTLAKKLEAPLGGDEDWNSVPADRTLMNEYILALLDIYQENYLELLDELNKFPGAQIIAFIFAQISCPRPPLFNPGIDDFIKSLGLPFCRNTNPIVYPYLDNPFLYLPTIKDLMGNLFKVVAAAFMEAVRESIKLILEKVCEVLGDAICHALETVGDLAASLPDMIAGRSTFSDVIKESICGSDADDDMVNNTIAQLMNDLGPGGAAMADRGRALTFAEDISSAATKSEMLGAMLGEGGTGDYLAAVDSIIEYEYPEFRDALPGVGSIESFFNNVGNLTPLPFRAEMREIYDGLTPEQAAEPINPTLCATPEKLESFKELRCQLLEGRASPEQCAQMFDDWRGTLVDDLGILSDALQQGNASNDPFKDKPLFSDPDCNNGLLPREPEVLATAAAQGLAGGLDKLKIEYSVDMLGDGPRQNNYGFINMTLADTLGNPYSVHQTKTNANMEFVDFYTNPNPWGAFFAVADPFSVLSSVELLYKQKGAFPEYVAEYLKYQFVNAGNFRETGSRLYVAAVAPDLAASLSFNSSNDYTRDIITYVSFASAEDWAEGLLSVPDQGYNVEVTVNYETERYKFNKKARKSPPDITLEFRDNAKGNRLGPNGSGESADWGYGFDIHTYIADIYKDSEGNFVNREDDNTRVYITTRINQNAKTAKSDVSPIPTVSSLVPGAAGAISTLTAGPAAALIEAATASPIIYREYSFLAIDDGLDMFFNLDAMNLDPDVADQARKDYNLENYPNFAEGFVRHVPETPQVNLLYDFFNGEVSKTLIKTAYDSFMNVQLAAIAGDVGANDIAWTYGASFDDLSFADFEYVVPKGTDLLSGAPGDPISEVEIQDYDSEGNPDGPRPIRDSDAILGVSKMQFDADRAIEAGNDPIRPNRVFYLDPTRYGANYMNPPVYTSPMTGSGWLGIVDLLFPELSPCKPSNTNLIDFTDIANKQAIAYTTIPDDPRILQDPKCTEEVPYNRMLERPAAAGIQGLIIAAIRIFVSVHYLKSLATFTQFAPKFPENYSNVYAQYIVERMREAFMNSSTQWFSPLQDNEFWYAFLEQAVQMYGYMVDADAQGGSPWIASESQKPSDWIDDPDDPNYSGPWTQRDNLEAQDIPVDVIEALEHINDYQQAYVYPTEELLAGAKYYDLAGTFESLESYRQEQNLAAVKATEDSAKTILKELVIQELKYMSDKFIRNLKPLGMKPAVTDVDYYYMSKFCAGSTLDLQKEFVETTVALPSPENGDPYGDGSVWPGPYYTNGNEFSLPDGSTYVGYYHGYYNDDESRTMYMIGEEHSTETHEELRPFANKVQVQIGDVPSVADPVGTSPEQPFIIQKYISINGTRTDPSAAVTLIKSKLAGNISDHYPGTLDFERAKGVPVVNEAKDSSELILTQTTEPATGTPSAAHGPMGGPGPDGKRAIVGLKGELGVRYGLTFKMAVGDSTSPQEIVSVEIDALDVPVSAMPNLEGNSKLLLCLLGKLKDHPRFKLITQYVFSMKRALAMTAIYNDMGFLPSIGEYTVEAGALHGVNAWSFGPSEDGNGKTKPGGWLDIDVDAEGFVNSAEILYEPGWAAAGDRNNWGDSPFFMKYDEWDQTLLRNSVRSLRDMFRTYYYARDINPSNYGGDGTAAQWIEQLKERFKFDPSKAFLPWWKQNRIRSNPFNSNGQLCTKKD